MDFIGKGILVASITTAIDKTIEIFATHIAKTRLSNDKREKICETIIAIKTATEKTRTFINQNGFTPNTDLTKLWRDALQKAVAADINEGLEDFLYHKADFWGNPQEWLNNPSAMKLVPKLVALDKKCDILLEMIKKK